MGSKTEKELISILMESPLYFVLGLKERYSLLSRLTEICRDKEIAEFSASPKTRSDKES